MTIRMVVWILAAAVLAPACSIAASERAALLHKAEIYAFEAGQYGAAGKPVTNAVAKRYEILSRAYRALAIETYSGRSATPGAG